MSSVFTKIINRELPAEVLFENEHVIAIHDIAPVAPIHVLIIAKKEIPSIQCLQDKELFLMKEVIKAAQHIAKELDITDYRLLTNCGEEAGQTIFHLHFHLLAGKRLGMMCS